MAQKRILLIEDDAEIRTGIRLLLGRAEYTFLEAENGERGLRLMDQEIDLVILDIMLPGIDGLTVCERIRSQSSVPILLLSARSQETDKLLGLRAGADDYMTKPFSYIELNARVTALLRRYHVYGARDDANALSDHLELDGIWISCLQNEVLLQGKEVNLTEKEYQILLCLMKKPNRSHSAKLLYETIWEEPFFYGASNIIMVHIRNLRTKIEKTPHNPCHIVTVWGKGYQFRTKEL